MAGHPNSSGLRPSILAASKIDETEAANAGDSMLNKLKPVFARRRIAIATLRSADRLRDTRQWDAAAPLYKAYLRLRPRDAAIWVQLGHCQKEAGFFDEADASYRRAAMLAPQVSDTWLQIGHLRKVQGNLAEAVANYARALKQDPTLTPARSELEHLGYRSGEVAQLTNDPGAHPMARRIAEVDARISAQYDRMDSNLGELNAAIEALRHQIEGYAQQARDHEQQIRELRSVIENLLTNQPTGSGLDFRAREIYDQLTRSNYRHAAG